MGSKGENFKLSYVKHFFCIILLTMKHFIFSTCLRTGIVVLLLLSFINCTGDPRRLKTGEEENDESAIFIPQLSDELPVSSFGEIWAYVVAGEESAYKRGLPITDIGYFGAEIDSYGSLTDVPRRQNLSAFPGRVHLVVGCASRSLSHFILIPGSREQSW